VLKKGPPKGKNERKALPKRPKCKEMKMCLKKQLVDDCQGFLPKSKVRRPCTDHVSHKGEGSCQEGEKIFVESLPGRITNRGRLRVRTFAWARLRQKNGFAYQNEGSGRL